MCGRINVSNKPALNDVFKGMQIKFYAGSNRPGFNQYPTSNIEAVSKDGHIKTVWGLQPTWATSPISNATSEKLFTSRYFKPIMAKGQRLIIPVNGYFEWVPNKMGQALLNSKKSITYAL